MNVNNNWTFPNSSSLVNPSFNFQSTEKTSTENKAMVRTSLTPAFKKTIETPFLVKGGTRALTKHSNVLLCTNGTNDLKSLDKIDNLTIDSFFIKFTHKNQSNFENAIIEIYDDKNSATYKNAELMYSIVSKLGEEIQAKIQVNLKEFESLGSLLFSLKYLPKFKSLEPNEFFKLFTRNIKLTVNFENKNNYQNITKVLLLSKRAVQSKGKTFYPYFNEVAKSNLLVDYIDSINCSLNEPTPIRQKEKFIYLPPQNSFNFGNIPEQINLDFANPFSTSNSSTLPAHPNSPQASKLTASRVKKKKEKVKQNKHSLKKTTSTNNDPIPTIQKEVCAPPQNSFNSVHIPRQVNPYIVDLLPTENSFTPQEHSNFTFPQVTEPPSVRAKRKREDEVEQNEEPSKKAKVSAQESQEDFYEAIMNTYEKSREDFYEAIMATYENFSTENFPGEGE